ncbi:MAG: hypothetical protein MUC40_00660 [Akkermansiaceae bacterium]|nr:hypothetical protein [Akkermansiaceae bacterium]
MNEAGNEPPGGGTPASSAPPVSTPPPADPPQRPEWFPEKYWKDGGQSDIETLGRSYLELERKFHTKFPTAGEVPEKPDAYQLKPEKLPDGIQWSDEAAAKFAEVFHAQGIPTAAAQAIVNQYLELEAGALGNATKEYERQLAEGRAMLEEKWGGADAYRQRAEQIEQLVTGTLGGDPNDPTLFSNPRVVEFLGRVADVLSEDAQAALKGSVAPGGNFASGADLAGKIMNDPSHPEHARYMQGDPQTVAKVMRLLQGPGE